MLLPPDLDEIVEHTSGIIKRQGGFSYITTKRGMKRMSADVGLMFSALNLRRLINLIDMDLLKRFLKVLCVGFSAVKAVFSFVLVEMNIELSNSISE